MVAVPLAGLVIAFGTSTYEVYRLEREAAELSRTKQQLQEHSASLHEEIKALYTSSYIEKLAREQLGLVKPGEIAVLIVHPPTPAPVPAVPHAEHVSWGTRLWTMLMRVFGRAPERFH